jgi:hypothetical protein
LSDELIDDGEAENPGWISTPSLEADDFQSHGELIIKIVERLG